MSIARLHRVERANKPQGECGKCHKPINKGDGYQWWTIGFRSRNKRKHCLDCPVTQSQRESNDTIAMIYVAGENFDKALMDATTKDDLKSACDTAAEEVREAISDWEDKKSNLEGAFPGGSPIIEQIEEYITQAESLADALECFDEDAEDTEESDDAETEEEKETKAGDAIDSLRDTAQSCWADNCEF